MNQFIVEMTATGGIMISAIGLNLLGFIKIKVANLLPYISSECNCFNYLWLRFVSKLVEGGNTYGGISIYKTCA